MTKTAYEKLRPLKVKFLHTVHECFGEWNSLRNTVQQNKIQLANEKIKEIEKRRRIQQQKFQDEIEIKENLLTKVIGISMSKF
jgi:hypothetical protein